VVSLYQVKCGVAAALRAKDLAWRWPSRSGEVYFCQFPIDSRSCCGFRRLG